MQELYIPAGSTIKDLINVLGLRLNLEETLLVVNHHLTHESQVLNEGDEIHFIPAISGG